MICRLTLYCILVIGLSLNSYGQTVSIQSRSEVCLNDVITFEPVITGTASGYNWAFGDNSSSTQRVTSHTYSTAGTVTVTLTVNFGGTTQSATKTITVHDLPTADFTLDGSNYCFLTQDICLTDKSTMGSTTSGYAKRTVLWGDGSVNSSLSPGSNPSVCYGSYPSIANNPYTIIVEVVNDKGCEDKWQQNINVLKDYEVSYSHKTEKATCDYQEVCFTNDSTSQLSDIASFEWDYGDGTTNTTNWSGECHQYTTSGTFRATLTVKLKNGCEATYSRVFPINIFQFQTSVVPPLDSIKCFPEPFRFSNALINGANYQWILYTLDSNFVATAGSGLVQNVIPPYPGDFLVRLSLTVGACVQVSEFHQIRSEGVSSEVVVLNAKQCLSMDTVYTIGKTIKHPDAILKYSWDFDDSDASNCTGWRSNCNLDTNPNSRHLYSDTGCYTIFLEVEDIVSGCKSASEGVYTSVAIDYSSFKWSQKKLCTGFKKEYGIRLEYDICDGGVSVCADSLMDSKLFKPVSGDIRYPQVADPDGWVTLGVAMTVGSDKVYRSHDLSDFYIDSSRICNDTQWYHHRFRFSPEPKASFQLISGGECLPATDTLRYTGGEGETLSFIKYSWDNAHPISTDTIKNDTLPDLIHTYTEQGRHDIYALLQNVSGCYSTYRNSQLLGYFNVINAPVNLCVDKDFTPRDSILYFDDPRMYWRDPNRPESMSWDFGDGGGFTATGPLPTHSYGAKGRYEIRLASEDGRGCKDTTTHLIDVGSINAAIKSAGQDYLCDQIVQFFDSSYFDIGASTDFITDYYWDFGDFTTTSILQNPFHYYSTNGNFILTLAVKTDGGCIDTARIPVYLKGPEPYFDITSDTMGCVPFTATFKSTSNNTRTFIWRMGDQSQTSIYASKDTVFSFIYSTPGEYFIYLEGSDSFVNEAAGNTYQCSALFPDTNRRDYPYRKIIVLPVPEVSFNIPEPICVGDTVLITDESDDVYTNYNWSFNGRDTTSQEDLKYVFKEEGLFTVNYRPTYLPDSSFQRHCFDSFSNDVEVFSVEAGFSFEEQGLCSEYIFTDSSVNATSYVWDFDHPKSGARNASTSASTSHVYGQDTGTYTACLAVQSIQGCKDTFCADLLVEYIKSLDLYNVFTPNSDGTNDTFYLDIVNQRKYIMKIYNRWGELMFESFDPKQGWDGNHLLSAEPMPEGTYFWVLDYGYNCERDDRLAEGIVELIRQ